MTRSRDGEPRPSSREIWWRAAGRRAHLARPVVLALIVTAAAACTTSSHGSASAHASGAEAIIPLLRIGTADSESSLDPTKNAGAYDIVDLALDDLMKFGSQGQVEPNLATSVTQPNPVTYVYHIRHGVKFWNGDPLSAADVAYSLNYYRAAGSQVAYQFPVVKSIRATDQYTVVVSLPAPDPAWIYTPALAELGIFEAKFAEAHKDTFGKPGTLIMGTGPWKVDSLDPTTGAELSANPDWWGGRVPIQQISVKVFSNETSVALAFRAGEIDFAFNFTNAKTFASTSGARLLTTPSCQDGWFSMNTQTAPWSDVHVRRAVAYALNRSDIITALGGYATPLNVFIPAAALLTVGSQPQVSQLLGSLNLYPYNLAKARQEMAQSPYPHGVSTTISVYQFDNSANVAQVVAAELQRIGIQAQVKSLSLAAWSANETGPARQRTTSVIQGGCTIPDVSGYDFYLGSANAQPGSWNTADYTPPQIDRLLTAGTTTDNSAARFEAFSGILRQMSADVPYVPLDLRDFSVALASKFRISGLNYWPVLNNNYGLNIRSAS
jgi:peptide/nickel transport system substrate-binding protein